MFCSWHWGVVGSSMHGLIGVASACAPCSGDSRQGLKNHKEPSGFSALLYRDRTVRVAASPSSPCHEPSIVRWPRRDEQRHPSLSPTVSASCDDERCTTDSVRGSMGDSLRRWASWLKRSEINVLPPTSLNNRLRGWLSANLFPGLIVPLLMGGMPSPPPQEITLQ